MSDEDNLSAEDILKRRHRKERAELLGKTQQLKKSVGRNEKKKKRQVSEEIAILEAELNQKHEIELKELLQKQDVVVDDEAVLVDGVAGMMNSFDTTVNVASSDGLATETAVSVEKKPQRISKAQKRRAKKEQQVVDRERAIREQEVENLTGVRHTELRNMKAKLKSLELKLHEVPSDGNCMYVALSHQLEQVDCPMNYQLLRSRTAVYMKEHSDEFLPFLTSPSTGDMMSEAEYEKYCDEVENTSAWGGQLELRALTHILEKSIEVIQSDAPPIIIGEEYSQSRLRLTYHRHTYTLGEHYNSVCQRTNNESEEES